MIEAYLCACLGTPIVNNMLYITNMRHSYYLSPSLIRDILKSFIVHVGVFFDYEQVLITTCMNSRPHYQSIFYFNVVVTVKFTVTGKEYVGKLSNQAMLQCSVFAHVKEKDQYWVGKVTQQFSMPSMSFSFPSGSSNAKKGMLYVIVGVRIEVEMERIALII